MQKFLNKKHVYLISISIYVFLLPITICFDILRPVFSNNYANKIQHNLDYSMVNTFIYFSAWFGVFAMIWAVCKFMNYFRDEDKKIKWAEKDNTVTMVATYAMLDFIINLVTLSIDKDLSDYNSWLLIIKSTIQHWVLPFYLFVFCLSIKRNNHILVKDFLKQKSWKILILPTIYLVYIYVRYTMLVNYSYDYTYKYDDSSTAMEKLDTLKNQGQLLKLFPYFKFSPLHSKVWVDVICSIFTVVLTFWIAYGFNILAIYLNNWKLWTGKINVNEKK